MTELPAELDPMDFVRARDDDTGYERTVRAVELLHGNYTVLDEDAVHPQTGEPFPPTTRSAAADTTDEGDDDASGDGAADDAYPGKSKAELQDDIESRNSDRDPASDRYIQVAAPGNKPDLIAALRADDADKANRIHVDSDGHVVAETSA